uniref:Uncharacterized protein n=1 Tax=Physcomitrium patens TaxID=3218 RepID=A0A2K1L159_PHYPA|nr:hypothetical protein PHYPA_002558 [Physcomitrium patens]
MSSIPGPLYRGLLNQVNYLWIITLG